MTQIRASDIVKALGIKSEQQFYNHEGKWFHAVSEFPCVLFDLSGYIVINKDDLENYRLSIVVRGNHTHVDQGISNLSGYKRFNGIRTAIEVIARYNCEYPLSSAGARILEVICDANEAGRLTAGNPVTYLGYQEIHTMLGLPLKSGRTWGQSLEDQGLTNLALWAKAQNLPALTGFVVNKSIQENLRNTRNRNPSMIHHPGTGYFKMHKKSANSFEWWNQQCRTALTITWREYIKRILDRDCAPAPDFGGEGFTAPGRRTCSISRIIRDTLLVQELKTLHDFKCQICGEGIPRLNNNPYVEGHHIIPLGQDHNGHDTASNVIVVCPNHHAMLDYGSIELQLENIRTAFGHIISPDSIKYHNDKIYYNNE